MRRFGTAVVVATMLWLTLASVSDAAMRVLVHWEGTLRNDEGGTGDPLKIDMFVKVIVLGAQIGSLPSANYDTVIVGVTPDALGVMEQTVLNAVKAQLEGFGVIFAPLDTLTLR